MKSKAWVEVPTTNNGDGTVSAKIPQAGPVAIFFEK